MTNFKKTATSLADIITSKNSKEFEKEVARRKLDRMAAALPEYTNRPLSTAKRWQRLIAEINVQTTILAWAASDQMTAIYRLLELAEAIDAAAPIPGTSEVEDGPRRFEEGVAQRFAEGAADRREEEIDVWLSDKSDLDKWTYVENFVYEKLENLNETIDLPFGPSFVTSATAQAAEADQAAQAKYQAAQAKYKYEDLFPHPRRLEDNPDESGPEIS